MTNQPEEKQTTSETLEGRYAEIKQSLNIQDEVINLRNAICALIPNFPEAQKEIRKLRGEIKSVYFDLAYGVTPALFITYQTETDEFTERVRLQRTPNDELRAACEEDIDLKGVSLAIVMKIIRAGFEGERATIADYSKMLATIIEESGRPESAERLRRYAFQNFGNQVFPVEHALDSAGSEG